MNILSDILVSTLGGDVATIDGQYPLTVPTFFVEQDRFIESARAMKKADARLVAEWATDESTFGRGFGIYACFNKDTCYLIVKTNAPLVDPAFPSLTKKFVSAWRFERQIMSLMGIVPIGHPDMRPWIKHEDWPEDAYPLRKDFDPSKPMQKVPGEYIFIRAEGEGVHEIAVGPIHAGIIEPGHFRFQAVGEDVLNLEERLGYVHKGIEKRFEALSWEEGARLSGRVSGDTTVAHTLAYCRAVEAMTDSIVPGRGLWLRALMLERERIANHLGDIGAIANDAAFAFLFYQFMRLREIFLRTNHKLFGHRLLMDRVVPGGVSINIASEGINEIYAELDIIEKEFEKLVVIYDENPSIEDRVRDSGILTAESAKELGVVGFVARASGLRLDCRIQSPFPPYDLNPPKMSVLQSGDVHARAWVRIEEVRESARLIRNILRSLPSGEVKAGFKSPAPDVSSFSVVEGWRGEIVYWVQSGPTGEINRCMVRDPSSVCWIALEQAIHGNIVPDFPLCNKSFNQSYSGHDL